VRRSRGTSRTRRVIALLVLVAILVLLYATSRPTAPPPPQATVVAGNPAAPANPAMGKRTKTKGCVTQGALPDPACTPGDVLTTDVQAVCTPGYSGKVRAVSSSTKAAVYAEYGITSHPTGAYEVDHQISLELGGSNSIANLWPEAAEPRPGFHEKDKVENFLHQQVCNGVMTLPAAQATIATNWLAVYQTLP